MHFLIAYHTQTIYKSKHIKHFSDVGFKASKIHLKIGHNFFGTVYNNHLWKLSIAHGEVSIMLSLEIKNLTLFSSKINVQDLILKQFSVQGVSMLRKPG